MSSIKRKSHCLQKEKSLAIPRHVIFVDTETTQVEVSSVRVEQRLKLGWACYYRKGYGRHLTKVEWCSFNTALEFWSFVYKHCERKRKLWIIARNIVFDFTVLDSWQYLRRVGFKLKFFHNKGTTTIISVKGRFGSIVFIDSMNWFRESLKQTGERIGLPKLNIDFSEADDEYLSLYCRRDVEIELENFKQFVNFLEGNHISRLCYTIGSTAMAAYLFGHYHDKIYIHNNKEAIDLERESFRGGRVECFYLGDLKDGKFYILDVNSLYPFVMANNLYPIKYQKISHRPQPESFSEALLNYSVVAKVLIDTDEPVYAVRQDRTIFPIGRFWVTLTTPELKYALSKGHIVEVGDMVVYQAADIFSKYVNRFYQLRRDFVSADVVSYAEICKLLLNSLYGKFGQKADNWKKVGDCPNEPDRIEVVYNYGSCRVGQLRYLLGEIFELQGYSESFNSFPAISAHVTAYGRMYLWSIMKQVGEGNYFYCDTDSLIVNEVGLCNIQNLIDNARLGGLKLVESAERVIIRGLKDYTTPSKRVIKGISFNAIELSKGVYEQEQWPSFQGVLRAGATEVYTVKKTTKILTRKYTKGVVNADGRVAPFALDDAFLLQR